MHLARKLFHASGLAIVAIYRGADLGRPTAAGVLGGLAVLLALLDVARKRNRAIQARFRAMFRAVLDHKDERGLNGSTLYFLGCAAAVACTPRDPACAGILALALGDPAAAIVGSSVRSPRYGRVSLAGSAACFAAATLGAAAFYPWPAALCAGAVATLLEACSGTKLDNLTMPVGVALALHLL